MENTVERAWDSITRSLSMSMEDAYLRSLSSRNPMVDDDEEALRWAAIEELPSFDRLRTGILRTVVDAEDGQTQYEHKKVDVRTLGLAERQEFIQRIFKVAEEDNERFLKKLRARLDKVGIELPTVEIRFEDIAVEAECYVGNRALPTLTNAAKNVVESTMGLPGISLAKRAHLTILKDATGIIKPSRRNNALVREMSKPLPGTNDLYFATQYSESTFGQFNFCLWKQWWTYWRSPDYNLVRFFFTLVTALLVGTMFWRIAQKRYLLVLLNLATSVQLMDFILSWNMTLSCTTVLQGQFTRSYYQPGSHVCCSFVRGI
ncbi:hypothetical protein COCNU_scaffold017399G000010 [Cocos nucifera]|nr:hypothetical protein [Cocos nucifera]